VEQGHLDVVKLLHKHRANLHQVRAQGETLLHCTLIGVTGEVHTALLAYLLGKGLAPDGAQKKSGGTPVHMAIDKSCLEAVQLLLQHGADRSICNAHGANALHLAVSKASLAPQTGQQAAVLKSILRSSSSSSSRLNLDAEITSSQSTALQVAAMARSPATVQLLLEHGAGTSADAAEQRSITLLAAISCGYTEIV
jgi:ankyrin repeat protein